LFTLESQGVTAIYTGYQTIGRDDGNGNQYAFGDVALVVNRKGVEVQRHIFDVLLAAVKY
jgi:hypothetical protein